MKSSLSCQRIPSELHREHAPNSTRRNTYLFYPCLVHQQLALYIFLIAVRFSILLSKYLVLMKIFFLANSDYYSYFIVGVQGPSNFSVCWTKTSLLHVYSRSLARFPQYRSSGFFFPPFSVTLGQVQSTSCLEWFCSTSHVACSCSIF